MESAEFKDWIVKKDWIHGTALYHRCDKKHVIHEYSDKEPEFEWCFHDDEGYVCSRCFLIPPEEIALFADLCFCEKW